MKRHILTSDQVEIAQRVCRALMSEPVGDALTAIISVAAGTINTCAGDELKARIDAAMYAQLLLDTVEAGLRSELILNDQQPLDLRQVI